MRTKRLLAGIAASAMLGTVSTFAAVNISNTSDTWHGNGEGTNQRVNVSANGSGLGSVLFRYSFGNQVWGSMTDVESVDANHPNPDTTSNYSVPFDSTNPAGADTVEGSNADFYFMAENNSSEYSSAKRVFIDNRKPPKPYRPDPSLWTFSTGDDSSPFSTTISFTAPNLINSSAAEFGAAAANMQIVVIGSTSNDGI